MILIWELSTPRHKTWAYVFSSRNKYLLNKPITFTKEIPPISFSKLQKKKKHRKKLIKKIMFAKFNGNSVTICGRLPKSLLHLQGHYDYLWIVFVRNNAIPKNLQAFFTFVEQTGWMNAVIEVWDSTSTKYIYLNWKRF